MICCHADSSSASCFDDPIAILLHTTASVADAQSVLTASLLHKTPVVPVPEHSAPVIEDAAQKTPVSPSVHRIPTFPDIHRIGEELKPASAIS